MSQQIIPAVGYLRKSTKEDGYQKSIGDQQERIKLLKPAEPGASYRIVRWYTDPGIQGWKRGHKRPSISDW
jgi:Resolvase, N terminal domain